MTCYEQTISCGNSGCKLCENDLCLTCLTGYYLINDMCYSLCGDGIMADLEECDDANLLNGDGCDNNCTESKNSKCKDNECVVLGSTYSFLEIEKEQSGVQYVKLRYCDFVNILTLICQHKNYPQRSISNYVQFKITNAFVNQIIELYSQQIGQKFISIKFYQSFKIQSAQLIIFHLYCITFYKFSFIYDMNKKYFCFIQQYSTKMRLIDGFTQQDYLDNLKFEIENQTDVVFIQIMPKINITYDLQFVDIQVLQG